VSVYFVPETDDMILEYDPSEVPRYTLYPTTPVDVLAVHVKPTDSALD
jgi:hypothetical protein